MLLLAAAVILLAVAFGSLNSYLGSLEKRRASREQTLKELMLLQQRYKEASAASQSLGSRTALLTAGDNPAAIIEGTGIVPKGGMQSRPLPPEERGQILEEGAEINLSGLSLNDTVNLLYRLENGTKPVAIKKGIIRTRFSDPAKLDITLNLVLFRPSAQQGKR